MEKHAMEKTPMLICLLVSIFILMAHGAFYFGHWTHPIYEKLLAILVDLGLFDFFFETQLWALLFAAMYALGIQGVKEEGFSLAKTGLQLLLGLGLYFGSYCCFWLPVSVALYAYFVSLTTGYLLLLGSLLHLRRIIFYNLLRDQFNAHNRRFPQERKKIENPYSVNIKTSHGWLNIINPFRATMVLGTPGSGKSYAVVEEFIRQHTEKGFSMLIYDFKYPDLSQVAYNYFLNYRHNYKVEPKIYIVNFADPMQSHRVNPIAPKLIQSQADALAVSEALFLNLNKEYIKKKDFFTSSGVNLVAAIIWFLRNVEDGKYCHIPMVILFMNLSDQVLFTVLQKREDIAPLLSPFADALGKKAYEQLAGQTASARIPLSRLATKELFWILSANDFDLTINDPNNPALLLLANDPQTQKSYGAIFGLLASSLVRVVNKKDRLPLSLIIDELPTIYIHGLDNLIATARSNKISTLLSFQDLAQLERDYGREVANAIFNTVGNKVAGAVVAETAKKLSDMIGKTVQERANISHSTQGTSIGKSTTLDYLIPPEIIAQLSQGEFCGVVADTYQQQLPRKIFHSKLLVDKKSLSNFSIPPINNFTPMEFSQKMQTNLEELNVALKRIVNAFL